jgi:hypothetical protein
MEEGRLAISPEGIEAYFHRFVEFVDGISAYFIFKVDQTSHQSLPNRAEKACYVPSQHTDDEIAFPVPVCERLSWF